MRLDSPTCSDGFARLDTRYAEPWTRATLEAIANRPRVRAASLASARGGDTLQFKADVRRLKALGLTPTK